MLKIEPFLLARIDRARGERSREDFLNEALNRVLDIEAPPTYADLEAAWAEMKNKTSR